MCTGSTGGALLPARAGVEASTEEARRELSLQGLESVSLSARRAEALRWVELHPGCTARELEKVSGLRKVAQRLTELERQGVVRGCTPRVCNVTGRAASTWHPTGAPPRPLPRLPSRRAQLEALQAEVARLREALATVASPLVLDGEEHAAAARLARETLAEVAP